MIDKSIRCFFHTLATEPTVLSTPLLPSSALWHTKHLSNIQSSGSYWSQILLSEVYASSFHSILLLIPQLDHSSFSTRQSSFQYTIFPGQWHKLQMHQSSTMIKATKCGPSRTAAQTSTIHHPSTMIKVSTCNLFRTTGQILVIQIAQISPIRQSSNLNCKQLSIRLRIQPTETDDVVIEDSDDKPMISRSRARTRTMSK